MKPKVAIVLSGYGVVGRGAEAMLEQLLPRLEDRFDLHVYSRSGRGPGGRAGRAIPREATEPLYLATSLGRKVLDTVFLDPLHVEWTSHLLGCLPALARGGYSVIWHETGLWGGFLLAGLRRWRRVKLLDIAHSSHPGWEIPFARRRPDALVTADASLAEKVRAAVAGVRVEVIPQAVDCDLYRPEVPPMELSLPHPRALVVGALSPEKAPEIAIRAIAASRASAVLAGTGPLATEIDRLAAQRLGTDRYRRFTLHRHQMPSLYTAADVIVLTSPLESGALALLEGMAAGKPVVSVDDAVRRELVGEAGLLVAGDDATAFARAIDRALEITWGDKPRQRALRYSLERQAQRFGDLLAELARSEP